MTQWERFGEVLMKKELEKEVAAVRTMYKRKDRKMRPVNAPLPEGINPGAVLTSRADYRKGKQIWSLGGATEQQYHGGLS